MPAYLAIDLGAESGRVLLGTLDDGRLRLEEVHRFPNRPVPLPDGLHWDVLNLYAEMLTGMAAGAGRASQAVATAGVDAWGNDFALLDRDGRMVANPWHYRDPRTVGMPERLTARVGARELYQVTGSSPLPINTACQLLASADSPLLAVADRLVMLPDLFTYWLTGRPVAEETAASTSLLFDITRRCWSGTVIDRLDLPSGLFDHELMAPGTTVGPIRRGLPGLPDGLGVVTVAGHDTASAVAAVPASDSRFGYVCSGTWSLVGVETRAPVLTDEARLAGFSHEAGVAGTTRLLRNLTGLWLLQQCREAWRRDGSDAGYAELTALAAREDGFGALIDAQDPRFLAVGDMPGRIRAYCRATGQQPPAEPAAMVRCILESLACRYRWTLEAAERLTGGPAEAVHMVGGGAANSLLCQLTADLTGRPVVAGPVEATGIGNVLVQAWADGRIGSLGELRDIVRRSFPQTTYEPTGSRGRHEEAYARFLGLMTATG